VRTLSQPHHPTLPDHSKHSPSLITPLSQTTLSTLPASSPLSQTTLSTLPASSPLSQTTLSTLPAREDEAERVGMRLGECRMSEAERVGMRLGECRMKLGEWGNETG